jgi:hypothetical protein
MKDLNMVTIFKSSCGPFLLSAPSVFCKMVFGYIILKIQFERHVKYRLSTLHK